MPIKDKFFYINIRDYLALGNDNEAGEPMLDRVLSGFSCPKNLDVEYFLKHNAIDFAKKSQSVTYLVFSIEVKKLVGYFTLALKPLTVRGETISNTTKKKLLRISELDEKSDTYTMAAYLIAQLGKNYANGENEEKLLSFYKNNRFSQFDTRKTLGNVVGPHELVQLLRLL